MSHQPSKESEPGREHPVERLVALIHRLRGPGGCPWDAEQTPQSVRRYLVEEAYEAAEAVREGDPAEITGELGDLLFQVLFMIEQYRDLELTDLAQVVEAVEAR